MKKIKFLLIILPLISLISITLGVYLTKRPSFVSSSSEIDDFGPIMFLSLLYIPIMVCWVLSGVYAKKLKRSVPGWVMGSFFLPIIVPFILAFKKPIKIYSIENQQTPNMGSTEQRKYNNDENENDAIDFGFCKKCIEETTPESPGNVNTLNGVGTMLMGSRWSQKGKKPCPECSSVIQTKWVTFGIGLFTMGTYRILYTKKGILTSKFYGRRLKSDLESDQLIK